MSAWRVVFALMASVVAACATAAIEWPTVPLPPATHAEKVGDELRVNGLPMRATAFESNLAVDEVVKFYLNTWRGQPGRISDERHVADWTVVARSLPPFHMTVQVRGRPGGRGTYGYIGITSQDASARPDFSVQGLPQPLGARLVSKVESDDGGRRSVQVTMAGAMSVSSMAAYYESSLRRDGWILERSSKGKPERSDGLYAVYNRGDEQLDLVFTRDDQSGETYVNASRVGPK
jgi:hypothetical protein